jgi:uncharacterized protein (DUF1919 family)
MATCDNCLTKIDYTKYAIITNTCLNITMYNVFYQMRYNHPFIAYLIPDDEEYVRFCKNFAYYTSLSPELKEPKGTNKWAIQNGGIWYQNQGVKTPYPVLHLGDIEFHCIHEHDTNVLIETFQRRIQRLKDTIPIFLLTESELMVDHTPEGYDKLITEFLDIPLSIYLGTPSPYNLSNPKIVICQMWAGVSKERNISHVYVYDNLNILPMLIKPSLDRLISECESTSSLLTR